MGVYKKMNDQMDRLRLFYSCRSSKNSKKEILGLSLTPCAAPNRPAFVGDG